MLFSTVSSTWKFIKSLTRTLNIASLIKHTFFPENLVLSLIKELKINDVSKRFQNIWW